MLWTKFREEELDQAAQVLPEVDHLKSPPSSIVCSSSETASRRARLTTQFSSQLFGETVGGFLHCHDVRQRATLRLNRWCPSA